MRKVIFQNMVTLDGFFEGPNHEIDWHVVDDEFNQYAIEFSKSIDFLLFGRKTYELMANYWSSENALRDDPIVAEFMNRLPKVVFSRTLKKMQNGTTPFWLKRMQPRNLYNLSNNPVRILLFLAVLI